MEEFLNKGLCGLCGNTGTADTTQSAISPAGVRAGFRRHCICPNGRALKKAKVSAEERGARETTEAVAWRAEFSLPGLPKCTALFSSEEDARAYLADPDGNRIGGIVPLYADRSRYESVERDPARSRRMEGKQ